MNYVSSLSPEYALLGLLNHKSSHGYELHQKLKLELGQVWHVSLSQTYNIINRLEAQGFIVGEVQEREKLPTRRLFCLTPAGRQRFETWLNTPTGSSVRAIRVEFITRLYFIHLTSPELTRLLIDQQDQEIRLGLERLRNTLRNSSDVPIRSDANVPAEGTFNRMALELRIRQLDSVLAWLEECRAELGSQMFFASAAPGQG